MVVEERCRYTYNNLLLKAYSIPVHWATSIFDVPFCKLRTQTSLIDGTINPTTATYSPSAYVQPSKRTVRARAREVNFTLPLNRELDLVHRLCIFSLSLLV